MRRSAVAAFAVFLGGYVLSGCIADRRGIERTESLLGGDTAVQLTSVEIRYRQRRVHCSDPDALRYLEECFREGDQHPGLGGGVTYLLRLQFAGGGNL